MKKSKIALWIFVLYVLQNIVFPMLCAPGYTPELMLCFAAVYAVCEDRYGKTPTIIIITALLTGCGTGRVFPIAVFFCGTCAAAVYAAKNYFRFIPCPVRMAAITTVFTYAMYISEYFAGAIPITAELLMTTILFRTIFTVAAEIIIYVPIKRAAVKNRAIK